MRHALSFSLIALFGCGDIIQAEGDDAGECGDAADNDQDGAFDCDDSDCTGSPDCAEEDTGDTGDTGGDDTGLPDQDPVCTEPVEPTCLDEMIQELSLHDDKTSKGDVTTTVDGEDFVTLVDATAGGSSAASKNAWTYVVFTQAGAEKLSIDDESALEDMSWGMGMRRFTIRLNSGDSGPSCVGVDEVKGKAYADVSAADIGAKFNQDDFYDDRCDLETDAIGGALTAMSDWWTYETCVETTLVPFLVQLQDGHVLKLVVEAYYADDGQEECNSSGSTTAESGWIQLRWRYLI